jgi:hypothetical protein
MSRTEGFHPLRALFRMVRGLFFLACVLIATFAVIGYASGWIEIRHQPQQDKAVIEIETGKAKQAAKEAITKGQELVQEAGDKIGQLGKQGASSPATKPDGSAASEKGPPSEQPKGQTGDAPAEKKRGD